MVRRSPSSQLCIPLKQREIVHPGERELIVFNQSELLRDFAPECRQREVCYSRLTRDDQYQVTRTCTARTCHIFDHLNRQVVLERRPEPGLIQRVDRTHRVVDGNENQPLCARALHHINQCVGLSAPVTGATWCHKSAHDSSRVRYGREHARIRTDSNVGQRCQGEFVACVGFVRTVLVHRLVPSQPLERSRQLRIGPMFAHDRRVQAFHRVHDILLMHEAHLQVELGMLRLPIRAQVFVAEALRNLEVTLDSADHQHLFQLLRRLRQCVEVPWAYSRRDDVVARTLWCRLDQYRGLYVCKPSSIHVVPD